LLERRLEMKALAAAVMAIPILFAEFDAMAQNPWCKSIDNRGSFQAMVVAHLAAFVSNANGNAPSEVTLEIERTIYDVPSKKAAAAIEDAYDTYNYLCDSGKNKDAEELFQQTAERIVMIAGYRDEPLNP
jgi:hypothetical protein